VLTRKECQTVILAQEDGKWYDPIVAQNESLMQSAKEYFVTHYYDMLQIYHGIIIATGALLFVLAFVNIAPAQEDVRFGFHLLVSYSSIIKFYIIFSSIIPSSCSFYIYTIIMSKWNKVFFKYFFPKAYIKL
jgi:hypothetical protein